MNETTRCAIYGRYSSEKQNSLTIDQQIRKCREYAESRSLTVLDKHIYADEAISGATDDRAGLRKLLAAARAQPKQFDVVLVDDTSRISRDLEHSLGIMKQLKFADIRVAFISQGFDTGTPQSRTLLTVHGLVDELYIDELAKKTFRGVEQRALNGLHTGGRVFGYRRVPIQSTTETDSHGRPVINGVRLEVHPSQAATIRRIFERYATGDSMKRIAMDLNGEGIASPQPRKGRSQSWCPSSIHHILHNERYRGMVIWGKTFKLRSQETRKRIYKRKAESEWCRTDVPGQRIVSDKLWNAVRERMKTVGQVYGGEGKNRPRSGRAAGSPYLFTGLLQCSECGGSITIVSGKWNGRQDHRYGCSLHWYRGGKICTNNLLIYRKTLETQLLGGLEQRVLNPEVIEYTLQSLEKQLMRGIKRQGGQSAQYQTRVDIIQKQIRNCTYAICAGKSYPSLMERLSELEQDLADAKAKLANAEPRTIRIQLRDTRRFVEMRLRHLQSVLNGEPRLARAEIMKHVQKITMTPDLLGKTYIASGNWDLLGNVAVTMVPGARIELATPAFSGRRSTNELPRQCCSLNSLESAQRLVKFRTSCNLEPVRNSFRSHDSAICGYGTTAVICDDLTLSAPPEFTAVTT